MKWYLEVLSKYTEFEGRARRKEYWYFFLVNFIISVMCSAVDIFILGVEETELGVVGLTYSLLVFLPYLAVTIRRLHDTDRSGWWVLIGIIPIVGWIAMIVMLALEGTQGSNRFGEDPLKDNDYDVLA